MSIANRVTADTISENAIRQFTKRGRDAVIIYTDAEEFVQFVGTERLPLWKCIGMLRAVLSIAESDDGSEDE